MAPLCAALQPSRHGRRLPWLPIRPRPPPKFSESRRRSVDVRAPLDPWHPSAPRYDPRATAASCPCSRSDLGRRRNVQSPAAIPLTVSHIEKKSKSRGGHRRPMPNSAGFAIGRLPPSIAGFLGLKNKLSLQGLAGEVVTIYGGGVRLK